MKTTKPLTIAEKTNDMIGILVISIFVLSAIPVLFIFTSVLFKTLS